MPSAPNPRRDPFQEPRMHPFSSPRRSAIRALLLALALAPQVLSCRPPEVSTTATAIDAAPVSGAASAGSGPSGMPTAAGAEAAETPDPSAALLPPDPPAPTLAETLALAPDAAPDAALLGLPLASDETDGLGFAGAGWLALDQPEARALAWSTGPAGMPHALALYARQGEGWRKLDQLSLDERLLPTGEAASAPGEPAGAFPFFLEQDVGPVAGGPGPAWIVLRGGWGANGGAFLLLDIAEDRLQPRFARLEAFPGSTTLEDLDGDGRPELVLDETDGYVFCRACGVAEAAFRFLTWDAGADAFLPVGTIEALRALPAARSAPLAPASRLAEAGLWKDALAALDRAEAEAPDGFGEPTLDAHARWIRRTAEARAEIATREVSPAGRLLHAVFYGDYAAVLAMLRAEDPAALLSGAPPLLEPGWESELRARIETATDAALAYAEAEPGWAESGIVHLLRGWSRWTAQPGDPVARDALELAAEQLPDEAFARALADRAAGHADG